MKRIISILLVLMLSMPSALAQTWITVSSWAYNDVSNFKKEGMLPESLDKTGDFTQPVTRLEFAHILYCALANVADNSLGSAWTSEGFSDTEDKMVLELFHLGVIDGEFNGEFNEYNERIIYFFPDRLLTREEMAVIMCRTANRYLGYDFFDNQLRKPDDFDEISEWAADSVVKMMGTGLISGVGDGRFAPKDYLTIEQAISIVYRLYKYLPTGQAADGATVDAKTETAVQSYKNGIVETKKDNILYLKQGDTVLMEFETDIYSNIFCETVDNNLYAAAQNCYGKTDIYDLSSKDIIAKIPYPVYYVDSEYITVKSSVIGPFSFGLYDWSGKEITEIKYSLSELDELKSTAFAPINAEYKAPSGMIYFSDWNDNGSLCVMDSNGENKLKLSEKNCVSKIIYLDDRLYFIGKENEVYSLYSVKTDGTGEVKITDYTKQTDDVCLVDKYTMCTKIPDDRSQYGMTIRTFYNMDDSLNEKYYQIMTDGEWIYYVNDNKDYQSGELNSIWRFKINDDNTVTKEQVTDNIIYSGFTSQFKDGKLYFLDEKKRIANGAASDLYCFDGNTITKLNGDLPILNYLFYDDKLIFFVGTESDSEVAYIAESDGSNPQIMEDVEAAKERYEQYMIKTNDAINNSEELIWETDTYVYEYCSDDRFTVFAENIFDGESTDTAIFISDAEGNTTQLADEFVNVLARYGDELIYSQSGELTCYDMNTGEKKFVADNHYRTMTYNITSDKVLLYYDRNLNIWRYNNENKTVEEIAPNSGISKYGNVVDMFGKRDGMYKLDSDGNYCLVTNKEYAANCLYVENGTGRSLWF